MPIKKTLRRKKRGGSKTKQESRTKVPQMFNNKWKQIFFWLTAVLGLVAAHDLKMVLINESLKRNPDSALNIFNGWLSTRKDLIIGIPDNVIKSIKQYFEKNDQLTVG
jgi:hypothetical protein